MRPGTVFEYGANAVAEDCAEDTNAAADDRDAAVSAAVR